MAELANAKYRRSFNWSGEKHGTIHLFGQKISSPTGEVILNFVAEDSGIISLIVLQLMYFHRWMVPDSQESRYSILLGVKVLTKLR